MIAIWSLSASLRRLSRAIWSWSGDPAAVRGVDRGVEIAVFDAKGRKPFAYLLFVHRTRTPRQDRPDAPGRTTGRIYPCLHRSRRGRDLPIYGYYDLMTIARLRLAGESPGQPGRYPHRPSGGSLAG